MNIIKKLFNKDKQKDEENNSIELDGEPSIDTNKELDDVKQEVVESEDKELEEQYNIKPVDNIPAKLYGVPNIRRIVLNNNLEENKRKDINSQENNN